MSVVAKAESQSHRCHDNKNPSLGLDEEDTAPLSLNSVKQHFEAICNHFNNEALSDLIVKVNGEKCFYAHKFLLAVYSDVFNKMLYDPNWVDDKAKRVIELNETEECEAVFEK